MTNTNFYKTLELPFFAPPPIVFSIVWPILYFLIALSIYNIYNKFSLKYDLKYRDYLILNYIFNQSYTFLFFNLKSPILGLLSTLLTLITSILLYKETKFLDKKTSYLLIPYLLWNIFASILSLTIVFMN